MLSSKVLNGKSLYESLYNKVYNVSQFNVFGTQYFPCIRAHAKNKWDQKSIAYVFMGHAVKKKVIFVLIICLKNPMLVSMSFLMNLYFPIVFLPAQNH